MSRASAASKVSTSGEAQVMKMTPAMEKRPVQTKQIEQLASQVEEFFSGSDREVRSDKIGEMIMEKLKTMDKVAYVRFASVYLEFKSLQEFLTELHSLLKKEE